MTSLTDLLFPGDGERTYAVVDGASCEELLDKLGESSPEHVCLYAGEIAPDVAEVAPYLVLLAADHPFTEWLLEEGLGRHWGIFVRSRSDLRGLRRHFRGFLLVRGPDGKSLYFRYYDPRVLAMYLPTCTPEEIQHVFGPVSRYLTENEAGNVVTRWSHQEGVLDDAKIALAVAGR